ncbi:Prophage CP4-57 integrase [bacterium YEK0313]|nr:Prophage CP4-57 integrase [bacterium YEK0313]
MARHKLTDTQIRATARVGVLGDGDGLFLRIKPSGRRSWIFIWRRFGIRREIGLGPYGRGTGEVSLAAARIKAEEARSIVGRGGNPREEMRERIAAKPVQTLGEVVDEYVEAMQSKWRGRQTQPAWKRFAGTYIKAIRKVPIDRVVTDDVLRVLRPLWGSKAETAGKTRERLKIVLDYGKSRGLRHGDNPAEWKGHLENILPPLKSLSRGHHAALPYGEIPTFMARLRAVESTAARALEFTILTAARSGETREATWAEFDFDAGIWTVPAGRMKGERMHRVPLVGRALEIIKNMRTRAIGDLVFPGRIARRPISDATFGNVLAALKVDVTAHGFRSTFRDWAADETPHEREVVEAAIAHAVGDQVERAYRRMDALEKRRHLMTDWDNYCAGK